MRLTLLLIFLFIQQIGHAQINRYAVDINHINAGFLEQEIHYYKDSITTTSRLKLEFITLADSQSYSITHHYVEDPLGQIIRADRRMQLQNQATTRARYNNPDYSIDNPAAMRTYGPEGAKKLSQDTLKSIGDSLIFWSYSPEHNKAVRLYRTIIDQSIQNAKKYWIVKDSIPEFDPIISLYDGNFNLKSAYQKANFGYLELRETQYQDSLPSLLKIKDQAKIISSNLWLPDPKNINAVELRVTFVDGNEKAVTLADNLFHPLPTDSTALAEYYNSNLWVNSDDLDLFSIADSLTIDLILPLEIAYELTQYCRQQSYQQPALQLLKMARNIDLPSRLVYGYYYQYGHWINGYWTEIGIGDEWQIFHPVDYSPINSSLYLPLAKSSLKNGILDFYLSPEINKIEITNFLRNGKPAHPKNLKKDYSNPGLGLGFNLPQSFVNQTDSTVVSPTFLLLSDGQNHIQLDYITPTFLTETYLKDFLKEKTGSENIEYNSFLPVASYESQSSSSAYLAIPQGDSFVLIECSGPAASSLMQKLTKKNLSLKK